MQRLGLALALIVALICAFAISGGLNPGFAVVPNAPTVTDAQHVEQSGQSSRHQEDTDCAQTGRQRARKRMAGGYRVQVVDARGRPAPDATCAVYCLQEEQLAATKAARNKEARFKLEPSFVGKSDRDGEFTFSFADLINLDTIRPPKLVAVLSAFPSPRPAYLLGSLDRFYKPARLVLPPTAVFDFSVELGDGQSLPDCFVAEVEGTEDARIGDVEFALPALEVGQREGRYLVPFVGQGSELTIAVQRPLRSDAIHFFDAGAKAGEWLVRRRLRAEPKCRVVRAEVTGLASLPKAAEEVTLRVIDAYGKVKAKAYVTLPYVRAKRRVDRRELMFLLDPDVLLDGSHCRFSVHIEHHEEFSAPAIARTFPGSGVIDLGKLALSERTVEIRGIVTNELGEALPGAELVVERQKLSHMVEASTDEMGRFAMKIPRARLDAVVRCRHNSHARTSLRISSLEATRVIVLRRHARVVVDVLGAPPTASHALLSWVALDGEQLGYKKSKYVTLVRGRGRLEIADAIPVRTSFYLYIKGNARDGFGSGTERCYGSATQALWPGRKAAVRIDASRGPRR